MIRHYVTIELVVHAATPYPGTMKEIMRERLPKTVEYLNGSLDSAGMCITGYWVGKVERASQTASELQRGDQDGERREDSDS